MSYKLALADELDSMKEGDTIVAADIEITALSPMTDTYRVDPAWNGRTLLSFVEVVDYVSEVAS
jgi:hypothetical protein